MDYLSLSSQLRSKKLYLFSLRDIENLFPREKKKTLKNNLTRWVNKGYCLRLKKDLYEFREAGAGVEIPDLYIANRLYQPSYVSLESALSIYGIIPDVAFVVTSVSTRPTRAFKNRYGAFHYKSCRRRTFTGYKLTNYGGFKVRLADKEKALVDFLYYRLRLGAQVDFTEERFNKKVLEKFNWKRAFYYAGMFNAKTLNTVKKCKEYALC